MKPSFNAPIPIVLGCILATVLLGDIVNAENVNSISSGISELFGHYANMMFGSTKRPPTNIKVAIVGLPRTGSGSLIEALQTLGYTTLHADEYIELSDVFERKVKDNLPMDTFVELVEERGFDAIFYWSHDFAKWAATSTKEDIKIILTVRDSPKRWAESYASVSGGWYTVIRSRPFIWLKTVQQMTPIADELFQKLQSDSVDDLEQVYLDHNQYIQEVVGADADNKLLMFNAKQGWEPLCHFLGKPVPSVPFPHANERFVLQVENAIIEIITWIWPLFPLLFLFVLWRVGVYFVQYPRRSPQTSAKKNS